MLKENPLSGLSALVAWAQHQIPLGELTTLSDLLAGEGG